MTPDRLAMMLKMVGLFPEDPRARYFLAHELLRREDWVGAAEHYAAYLSLVPGDEGTAYKNLGKALVKLNRLEEARRALNRGLEAALSHNHQALASEIRLLLGELDG